MAHDHDVVETAAARPVARSHAPTADAGPVTLAARVASPSSLLRLQRLAGNVAVQRAVAGDEVAAEVQTAPDPAPAEVAAAPAPAPAAAAPAAGGNTLGDGTGPVSINGPTVGVHAPMVQVDGVLRASTIMADSVVAASYSPGAGNIW